MPTNYLAIAFGRGKLRERLLGVFVTYEYGEETVTRKIEERASKGKIDILYKGPNKQDARRSVAKFKSVKELVDLL